MARKLNYAGHMERIKCESPTYKLEVCLGEGLSSCVYRAERLDSRGHSKQRVVLKILKNQNQVEWLRQEFEALSKIDSSFCVRMLAWENLKLGPALVLEYIEGITLFELLLSGPLEANLATEIIAQVQLGLLCLDRAGRFHGDLNLKNIMIDKSGCVKLIDFATSNLFSANKNEIVGTPPYIAPEIWQGQKRTIKSDLFALGLIETDIKLGISGIPVTREECQLRSEKLIDSDRFFFDSVPENRAFKKIQRSIHAKRQLGRRVTAVLVRRSSQSQQTLKLQLETPTKRRFQLAILSALAVSCFVTPVVSTPLVRVENAPLATPQSRRIGSLEVRTKQWIEISIDGKNYGYSPLTIDKLSSGTHRLKWASFSKSGEFKFKFEAGEMRILTESDFSGISKKISKKSRSTSSKDHAHSLKFMVARGQESESE